MACLAVRFAGPNPARPLEPTRNLAPPVAGNVIAGEANLSRSLRLCFVKPTGKPDCLTARAHASANTLPTVQEEFADHVFSPEPTPLAGAYRTRYRATREPGTSVRCRNHMCRQHNAPLGVHDR